MGSIIALLDITVIVMLHIFKKQKHLCFHGRNFKIYLKCRIVYSIQTQF